MCTFPRGLSSRWCNPVHVGACTCQECCRATPGSLKRSNAIGRLAMPRPPRFEYLRTTTQMGDNAETSVVNRWCLSHEVPNLGILGASVMGTSGATTRR